MKAPRHETRKPSGVNWPGKIDPVLQNGTIL